MAKPLDERIAAAFGPTARAATVADLIAELDASIAEAQTEHDRLDAISKSVTTSETEADAAADQVAKLSRRIARLTAKREQLDLHHAALINSERQQRLRKSYDEALARRDELAADLRERWPELVSEIVGLLGRIEANDAEIAMVNRALPSGAKRLESAEYLARKCKGVPTGRFGDIRLRSLDGTGFDEFAWPRHTNPMAVKGGISPRARLS